MIAIFKRDILQGYILGSHIDESVNLILLYARENLVQIQSEGW